MNKQLLIRAFIIFTVAFVAVSLYNNATSPKISEKYNPSYTKFINIVKNDGVFKARIQGQTINVLTKNGEEFFVNAPEQDPQLINDLLAHNVDVVVLDPPKRSFLFELFVNLLPVLLLVSVWIWFARKQSGNTGTGLFGKSNAKLFVQDENSKVMFSDVAGCSEEKKELEEIVEFLKNPEKFNKLGAKIPRGVLLSGPPGCGKTLISRAVANEADVPFYSVSGSDFIQMFVGVGASRVRDMFKTLREHEKAVLFIDEIDSIAKARNNNIAASSNEHDQTINQLLAEMDGFDQNSGIIVIGATNRPDILDSALRRPGRFDREVNINLPDTKGREEILKVHTKDIPIDSSVDLEILARGTSGFSGAELSNLVNEASLIASKEDSDFVDMRHFEFSKDKLLMGNPRSSLILSEEDKFRTAIHEVGHFLVAYYSEEHDSAYKMSIVPRGKSLGVTVFLPENDQVSLSKTKLESQIATLYGGRVAEELFGGFEKISTGASSDISRATEIATRMITEWGMSKSLVPMKFIEPDGFTGENKLKFGLQELNSKVEKEIEKILKTNYTRAKKILKENWKQVIQISEILVEKETVSFDDIKHILI